MPDNRKEVRPRKKGIPGSKVSFPKKTPSPWTSPEQGERKNAPSRRTLPQPRFPVNSLATVNRLETQPREGGHPPDELSQDDPSRTVSNLTARQGSRKRAWSWTNPRRSSSKKTAPASPQDQRKTVAPREDGHLPHKGWREPLPNLAGSFLEKKRPSRDGRVLRERTLLAAVPPPRGRPREDAFGECCCRKTMASQEGEPSYRRQRLNDDAKDPLAREKDDGLLRSPCTKRSPEHLVTVAKRQADTPSIPMEARPT